MLSEGSVVEVELDFQASDITFDSATVNEICRLLFPHSSSPSSPSSSSSSGSRSDNNNHVDSYEQRAAAHHVPEQHKQEQTDAKHSDDDDDDDHKKDYNSYTSVQIKLPTTNDITVELFEQLVHSICTPRTSVRLGDFVPKRSFGVTGKLSVCASADPHVGAIEKMVACISAAVDWTLCASESVVTIPSIFMSTGFEDDPDPLFLAASPQTLFVEPLTRRLSKYAPWCSKGGVNPDCSRLSIYIGQERISPPFDMTSLLRDNQDKFDPLEFPPLGAAPFMRNKSSSAVTVSAHVRAGPVTSSRVSPARARGGRHVYWRGRGGGRGRGHFEMIGRGNESGHGHVANTRGRADSAASWRQ